MHSVRVDLLVCAGGHAHQLAEVHVQPQLDLLLVFALVSVLNGLDCMCALNDMHAAESLACDQQQCSSCLLHVSCWDRYLTCMGTVSSVSAPCAHCCSWSCCNSFACLSNFMLFLELLLRHMQLLLHSILYFRATFMSRRHLIAWVSKVAFIMSGSALNLQIFSSSALPTTFHLPLSCVGLLPSVASHCDVATITSWYPCLWTNWCLHR